jgi:hypothetical protein
MNIFDIITKKKILITINFFILIILYYFSFNILPKLSSHSQYDYINIKTNARSTFLLESYNLVGKSNSYDDFINERKNQFLNNFISYLIRNPINIKNAPCPSEIISNNLRNIQLYEIEKNIDHDTFSVRFYVNKFSGSIQDTNIDQCFKYIFIENLNKYHSIYIEDKIKNLNLFYEITKPLRNSDIAIFNDDLVFISKEYNIETINKKKNFYKSLNFFIDPNVNIYSKKNEQLTYINSIISFIICWLTTLILQFMYLKIKKKNLLRYFNKFVNN